MGSLKNSGRFLIDSVEFRRILDNFKKDSGGLSRIIEDISKDSGGL